MSEQLSSNHTAMDPLLFPYYVYVLINPANNKVFYVGKGQGERVDSHWAEARRAIENGETPNSPKQAQLMEIANSGKDPVQLVIGRYESEVEALSVETTLINWMYGFDELTNLNRGYRNTFIRPFGNHGQLPGVDVPSQERSNDGEYSARKIEELSRAGAYDFMSDLSECLNSVSFTTRGFIEKEDRPYDPKESNGWLGLLVRIEGVDFIVRISKLCNPIVTVATTMSTRETIQNGRIVLDGIELALGEAKNNKVRGEGRFRDFIPKYCIGSGTREEKIAALCAWLLKIRIVKF